MTGTPGRLRSIDSLRRVRNGLDPDQVADLLAAQGHEIQQLRRAVEAALDEAQRAKDALRQWSAEHAATCQAPPARRPPQVITHQPTVPTWRPYPGGG